MKKYIVVFMAFILCVSSLTACDKGPEEQPLNSSFSEPSAQDYKLNQSILSDIGKTWEQLIEKYGLPYGNRTETKFEHGPGYYHFEDAKCVYISTFWATELFEGLPNPGFTNEELSSRYGIKYLKSIQVDGEDGGESYFIINDLLLAVSSDKQKWITRKSMAYLTDLAYFNKEAGLSTEAISSNFQFFGRVGIGFPESATVEDFLNDPLVKSWNKKIAVEANDKTVYTGLLTPDMIVEVDGVPFVLFPLD